MPSCLGSKDTEPILDVVKGDTLDQAREDLPIG
jgi:hypothetical protein